MRVSSLGIDWCFFPALAASGCSLGIKPSRIAVEARWARRSPASSISILASELSGFYFSTGSARYVEAVAQLDGESLTITANGARLASAPRRDIRVSSRLGALSRKLEFPDGGLFETRDNDGVDALLKGSSGILAWMERSWRLTLAFLVIVAIGAAWFAYYGVPAGAHWLALRTPPGVSRVITNETLSAIDRRVLLPTRLPTALQ